MALAVIPAAAQQAASATGQRSIQVPVLIEEFTNSGCGPCAAYAPTLDSVTSYRLGEAVTIKYHGSYPQRDDPYYLAQKDNIDKRIMLYGITGYPTTIMNGNEIAGGGISATVLNNAIDHYKAEAGEPAFKLELTSSVADGNVDVNAVLTPKADVQNKNLRLFVCLMEEYFKPAAPLANGEEDMRYTIRQILPDGSGYDLGASLKQGEQKTFGATTSLATFGDVRQLGIVGFIQDVETKKVYATAYIPRMSEGSNSVVLMNLEDTPDKICTPDYYGKVTFRNLGDNPVTSAIINVSVNGAVKQYEWVGELNYLDRATFSFDGFDDFTLNNASKYNDVEVWLSDINATDSRSNSFITSFSNSVQAEHSVQLKLYTNNKPEEISWKLYNSAGDVVDQSEPYTEKRHFYTIDLKTNADDCYLLEFSDAGGDGIKGKNGNGYYQLFQVAADGKRTRIVQADYTEATHDVSFNLKNATSGIADATISDDGNAPITVTDVAGRIVHKGEQGSFNASASSQKGVMLITTGQGSKAKTKKVLAE